MGTYKKVFLGEGAWLIASEKLMTVYLLHRQLFSTKIFGRKFMNRSDNNKKNHAPSQDSVKVFMRETSIAMF